MTTDDLLAESELLKTGLLVEVEVTSEELVSGPDGGEFMVRLELAVKCDAHDEPQDVMSWGAFGLIFLLASVSFDDARPRGMSGSDYEEGDHFRAVDLLEGLRFERGGLHYHGDYLRGRRMKTDIFVGSDGGIRLETIGRGKAALHWLSRLSGRKPMEVVGGGEQGA